MLALIPLVWMGCKGKDSNDASKLLKTESDSASYGLGLFLASRSVPPYWKEINYELVARAIKDFQNGGDSNLLVDMESLRPVLMAYDKKMQDAEIEEQAKPNMEEGEKFMAEFKKQKDVQVLPSGIAYQVITAGTGNSPKLTDTVVCHYNGSLTNGTTFDQTNEKPARFLLNEMIPGWKEVLPKMKSGGKWKIVIPYEQAYGKEGNGSVIPPGATLVFEVELLDIVPSNMPELESLKGMTVPSGR